MASYAEIRAQRPSDEEVIQKQLDEIKGNGSGPRMEDESYLDISHVRGPDGTGWLQGRFLPAPPGEESHFAHYYEYQFEGPGGWYIQKGRNSLGAKEKDPVYEYNGKLFKDKTLSDEERKKRLLGRREFYVVGFHVIKDPLKPENNGKTFRWKIGPQIWKIIENAMFPKAGTVGPEEDEPRKIKVFDPIEGADFILRVTTKLIGTKEVPSYETSTFSKKDSSLVANIADFDAIWNSQFSIAEVTAPSAFKSYEELVGEFNRAMGLDEGAMSAQPAQAPKETASAAASQPVTKSIAEEIDDKIPDFDKPAVAASDDGDDDWFNKLKKS